MKTINSIKVVGIDYVPIKCECVIAPGIGIHLVGLADVAVKESLLRTITAMQAGGWRIPGKKIVLNLAPADLTKSGEAYDLPIALAMIAESGQAVMEHVEKMVVVGELALDGHVRGVSGAVQACRAAVEQGMGCIVPFENWPEVAELFGPDAKIFPVKNLSEAIEVAQTGTGETAWEMLERDKDGGEEDVRRWRWDDIVGQAAAKRGLEIAAAGGHHVLLMGAVGTGKAGLARAMLDILPVMDKEEAMEVASVWSAAGKGMKRVRPFRMPFGGASLPAILGGGAGDRLLPGEVSLSSRGVLYMGDWPRMPKALAEALRGPVEDGKIVISRLKSKVEFPTKFQLVVGTEPCPCGYYGEGDACCCTPKQRREWLSKLSGPVLDRVDVQIWVHPEKDGADVTGDPASVVAERVAAARVRQIARQGKLNAELTGQELCQWVPADNEVLRFAETIVERLGLSARAWTRMLKIAMTIADLEGAEQLRSEHIAEAASFRFLDRRIEE